jgi:quercetin dioxygenase-like cupin family protein
MHGTAIARRAFGYKIGRPASKGDREKAMPVKAGVIRAAERQTRRGAAETFTGVVFQDPVLTANAPSRMGGSVVSFTPGARTAWHAHPVGQTLYCLSGVGRICFEGEEPQVLRPGDTVNIPPDTMHWHGAAPDRLFSHLALSEAGEQGQSTAWGKHVADEEYNRPARDG